MNLEKLYELKHGRVDVDGLKAEISSIPKVDTSAIVNAINNALMTFFSRYYATEAEKKTDLIEQLGRQAASEVIKVTEDQQKSFEAIGSMLSDTAEKLQQAIKEIPQTDLSSLDSAIKDIKPVDITGLQKDVQKLTKAVSSLSNRKIPKAKEINLQGVIDALNKPVNVNFDIEYDQWDYPTKIKATEVK